MSAPMGRSGLTPGDCLAILKQADKWREKGYRVTELPPRNRDDLTDALAAMRVWIDADLQAVRADAALARLVDAVRENSLGAVQAYDLRALRAFLLTVAPTRRPAA